jgi:hypothetical protein
MNFNIFNLIFILQRIIMYVLGFYIHNNFYISKTLTLMDYLFFMLSPGFFTIDLLNTRLF